MKLRMIAFGRRKTLLVLVLASLLLSACATGSYNLGQAGVYYGQSTPRAVYVNTAYQWFGHPWYSVIYPYGFYGSFYGYYGPGWGWVPGWGLAWGVPWYGWYPRGFYYPHPHRYWPHHRRGHRLADNDPAHPPLAPPANIDRPGEPPNETIIDKDRHGRTQPLRLVRGGSAVSRYPAGPGQVSRGVVSASGDGLRKYPDLAISRPGVVTDGFKPVIGAKIYRPPPVLHQGGVIGPGAGHAPPRSGHGSKFSRHKRPPAHGGGVKFRSRAGHGSSVPVRGHQDRNIGRGHGRGASGKQH